MKQFILAGLLCLSCSVVHAECVILLHGLARTDSSMAKMADYLREQNYQVVNVDYPSRHHPLEELAGMAIEPAITECSSEVRINFVTHSLGGILVRWYLWKHEIPNLHRVVMLGPPNQGAEVVDKLANVPGFHFINGDVGLQLGTTKNSMPKIIGAADFDVGIIAGSSSINFIFSYLIPGPDDGTVSVESTKLIGMNDHIVMPVTHPFMMRNTQVIKQVIHYLQHGSFINDKVD